MPENTEPLAHREEKKAFCFPVGGGGYLLRVAAPKADGWLVDLRLPDWESFLPQSAGHRLIECGFMIHPSARMDSRLNGGWKPYPNEEDSWWAPVFALDEFIEPGTRE